MLLTTPETKAATDWSSDGQFLLYCSSDPKTRYDLWALPLDGNHKPGTPFVVAQSAFDERDGIFSPDGHWVAYQSNESDRSEVYIQKFPAPDGWLSALRFQLASLDYARDDPEPVAPRRCSGRW